MSSIDKQALREEFQYMQDHYSDPADRERQVIYIAAEALLDELEIKEEQRSNWFQMAQKLGEDLDAAEKRNAEQREYYEGVIADGSKRIAEQSAIVAAAEKLVRCKGRYHSELNYRALAKLFGVITPDLPPLEYENVHYTDAAEVEISALRQRIQDLEAREVTLPPTFWYEHDDLSRDVPVLDKRLVKKAIRAAGIKVKGE
ncbi:ead/Ea22-like family protein [Salmonella enterica subsp. enterica]|nr:ead/Ea22-like family protein [Salmonella enterica]ECC3377603.1 ead/Ea22-like family protein [Salmonella enterica subsp. enterica]EDW3837137.1 ead/Ea22-like family protein [Salmonella enterica subsp. enterica]